jgi:hypothetical protein
VGQNTSLDGRTVLKAKLMDCMHYFERKVEVMKTDLPRFGGDIELCAIPWDFLPTAFRGGFGSCPWGSRRADLAVRMWPTRLTVITFSLWLYPALRMAFMFAVRRGRVLRGNDRCGGGPTTGTGEFLEEIPEFPENGYCQHHLVSWMHFYSTLFFPVFQVRSVPVLSCLIVIASLSR